MDGILFVVAIGILLILFEIREYRRSKEQSLERRSLKRAVDRLLGHSAQLNHNCNAMAGEVLHLRKIHEKTADHFDGARNNIMSNESKLDSIIKELEVRRERDAAAEGSQFDFVEL